MAENKLHHFWPPTKFLEKSPSRPPGKSPFRRSWLEAISGTQLCIQAFVLQEATVGMGLEVRIYTYTGREGLSVCMQFDVKHIGALTLCRRWFPGRALCSVQARNQLETPEGTILGGDQIFQTMSNSSMSNTFFQDDKKILGCFAAPMSSLVTVLYMCPNTWSSAALETR